MRILLVTKSHLPVVGGGQMTVHWLALALAGRGHPVSVLSVAPRAGAAADEDLGYPLVHLDEPAALTPELLDELGPDVAVLNGFDDGLLDWGRQLLGRLRPLPTTLYLHDARGVELAAHAESVAAVSRHVADLCGPATVAIPPIVDRARYRVPTTRERALFVNPVPEKGLATAIELARARPDIPFAFQRAWRLAPPALASLRAEVRALPNVELRDAARDPRSVYGDARLLLVPSVVPEAWGRVAREAQASGIPVVAAGVGGLPEAVGSGGSLVAPADGARAWLTALGRLWEDAEPYAVAVEAAERQGADASAGSEAVADAFERQLSTRQATPGSATGTPPRALSPSGRTRIAPSPEA